MSDQHDNQDTAHLNRVSGELSASLKRCRLLLDDCRSKLAANSNELEASENDDQKESDLA
jgi:hypothetical protein